MALYGIAGSGPRNDGRHADTSCLQQIFTLGRLKNIAARWKNSIPEAVYLAAVMFYSILLLANNTYNPFIYFRF